MAAAHPFGAFVGCRFKRIGCVRRIKVKFQASALKSGIKGLNNKKKLCTKHDTLHLLFNSWITTH